MAYLRFVHLYFGSGTFVVVVLFFNLGIQLFRRLRRKTSANIERIRHQRLRRFESIFSALELLLSCYTSKIEFC